VSEQKTNPGWIVSAALILFLAGEVGYLLGQKQTISQCRATAENLNTACAEGLTEVVETCKENMIELAATCAGRPSIQQDRIWKWEECFQDDNCRSCLIIVFEESGNQDVEYCHEYALGRDGMPDEPIPEYVPPPWGSRGL